MAQTPFDILALPERFDLNEEAVHEAWRQSIALVHPDKFAGRPAAERRVAEQWAGRINEAKDVLLDPVKRAEVLLVKAGVDVGQETDTRMSGSFLMEQLQWREEMEDAKSLEELNQLAARIETEYEKLVSALVDDLDKVHDYASARESVRRLMFVQKIRGELMRRRAG